ncbi:hypothetical protein, partial [Streptomyces sp. NPDC048473]|uniref:hypothetical protein n=1 Tax=Streptomyces sp. NPDC048473 TaxID=3365556 RepID=UPI0037125A12
VSQLADRLATAITAGAPFRLPGGGSGIESEYTLPMTLPDGIYPRGVYGNVLATGPGGATLVVETKNFYLGPNDEYFRTDEDAQAAGGRPNDSGEMAIPEIIFGVMGNLPSERRGNLDQAFSAYADIERRLESVPGRPGSDPALPLSRVFTPGRGWTLTRLGRGTLIGPRPIGDNPGAHVHHNIGVPLGVVHPFLRHVRDHTWRDESRGYLTRKHLDDALLFASTVASRFIYWKATGRFTNDLDIVSRLVNIPDPSVKLLRDHVTLLYVHGAALANGNISEALQKAHAAVLVRQDPATILAHIPQDAKDFLRSDAENILAAFERMLRTRIPDFDRRYYRLLGSNDNRRFSLLDLPLDMDHTRRTRDFLLSGLVETHQPQTGLQHAFTMTVLPHLDTNIGRTLAMAVLEVRSYGDRHVTAQTMQTHHTRLIEVVRSLNQRAERLHNPT